MKNGIRSSEFYVALVVVGAWVLKYLGLDAYLTPENMDMVAEAVKQTRSQGIDPAGYVGLLYVAGRVLLKWRVKGTTNGDS